MIVAERSRTGSHKWENDWCPKCKERLTFWYVAPTRTRCAMCATEKDKARGLGLQPEDTDPPVAPPTINLDEELSIEVTLDDGAPEEVAPSPGTPPAETPAAETPAAETPAAEGPSAPITHEEPPREPVWVLHWCPECNTNASFRPGDGRYFSCMGCGFSCEIQGAEAGRPLWQGQD